MLLDLLGCRPNLLTYLPLSNNMNIFVLSYDPVEAAQMASDRHSVKMILESAQMLCTVAAEYGVETPYKSSFRNHPCTRWVRDSRQNWLWLQTYALALCQEYTHRYGKTHKSESVIGEILTPDLPNNGLTTFPQVMPEEYRDVDTVKAYRRYYAEGKGYMNKGQGPLWVKDPRRQPMWFKDMNQYPNSGSV